MSAMSCLPARHLLEPLGARLQELVLPLGDGDRGDPTPTSCLSTRHLVGQDRQHQAGFLPGRNFRPPRPNHLLNLSTPAADIHTCDPAKKFESVEYPLFERLFD